MPPESAAVADPLSPGLRLGRYELIRRLAVGGMAEIYLARAIGIEGFEKLVVLKRILPQFAGNAEFVSMFLDEARLSATLQHPNIAQVHDIGQFDDSYFFTMEYVRGEDVRSILKAMVSAGKRIPLSASLTIIAGAAAGLHAAHEKRDLDGTPLNVVHRDVSPSNVLVSYDGAIKLVDFGVAKAAQRRTETAAGTLKGKVAYMSPEQCQGLSVDRRSDVFALGILLYELTCQRRLFRGASEFEIMTKIVSSDVEPPSERFPRYPKELEEILLRALARDPGQRYQSAQDLQVDLEEFARSARLPLSGVKLGAFMQKHFVERMREEQEVIARRPRTEELEGDPNDASGSGLEVDIEIEMHGAAEPRAKTLPAIPANRLWQLVAVGSLAALAAVVLLWTGNAIEPPAVEPAPSSESPSQSRSSESQLPASEPLLDTKAAAKPPAPPREAPKVQAAAATPPLASEPEAAAKLEPEAAAKPRKKPRRAKSKSRSKRRRARRRHRSRPHRAATKPRVNRSASWGLDSPLPPPEP